MEPDVFAERHAENGVVAKGHGNIKKEIKKTHFSWRDTLRKKWGGYTSGGGRTHGLPLASLETRRRTRYPLRYRGKEAPRAGLEPATVRLPKGCFA